MEDSGEREQYPETVSQIGPNKWDLIRVMLIPASAFFQGGAAMFDALADYAILQSQVFDEKKAFKSLSDALK